MFGKPLTLILLTTFVALQSIAYGEPAEDKRSEDVVRESLIAIFKDGWGRSWEGRTDRQAIYEGLGLLATKQVRFLEPLGWFANIWAARAKPLDVIENRAMNTEDACLVNLLLCEYYLLSLDPKVLPGIEALSTYLALGQSGYGTWGAEMRNVEANETLGENDGDNTSSLIAAVSLVLAEKCGVRNEAISDAIKRSKVYFRFYVNKGGIPASGHTPAAEYNPGNRSYLAATFYLTEAGIKANKRLFPKDFE